MKTFRTIAWLISGIFGFLFILTWFNAFNIETEYGRLGFSIPYVLGMLFGCGLIPILFWLIIYFVEKKRENLEDYTELEFEYIGDCENGQGTSTCSNGVKYVGEWKDGKKHGKGTETIDEFKYEGEWKDGEENGKGTETWSNGDKYVGEWKDGKKHGKGTETCSNGDKYEGEWKDGEKHGKGTETKIKKGLWVNGQYIGE